MSTIRELRKFAKEAKVKNRSTLNKTQLCLALGMEPAPANEKYERFCRGKTNKAVTIILIKKKDRRKTTVCKYLQSSKRNWKKPWFYILATKER